MSGSEFRNSGEGKTLQKQTSFKNPGLPYKTEYPKEVTGSQIK